MPWARRISTGSAVLSALLMSLAVLFLVLAPTRASWLNVAIGLAVVPLSVVLSLVVARRMEGGAVGVALGFLALTVAYTVALQVGYQYLHTRADAQQHVWILAVFFEATWWVAAAVGVLLVVFPDGHLPSRRWRWVPLTLIVCTALDQFYGAFEQMAFYPPNQHLRRPWGPLPLWLDVPSLFVFILMLALALACAFSLVLRFRRADDRQRQQIKWLALAGIGVPVYPLLCLTEIMLFGSATWFSGAVGVLSLTAIPVATAIAVLRHDLYDVDKALAGAVTWGILSMVLLAVYAVCSSWAGLLLGRDSALVAALTTGACAVALTPVRRVLQSRVDRRLYPLRRAAFEAVEGLHHDVSSGRSRPEELEERLRGALRDPGLRVGFRLPANDGYVDAAGAPLAATAGVAVVLDGVVAGVLVPGSGAASPELLRQVADHGSTMVEMVRLRLQVASALREAESSRARLVQIGYEERRRLERDLHDGAQQRLVSLGMGMRLAQRHLHDGTVDVADLLDQSVAELGTAVAELRQIAHGLRPSSLDDGLPAAISNLVRSVPLTVDMDIDAGTLPDAVATTAYFVVSEALANAIKHAGASRISLRVGRCPQGLEVEISDDGCGGARLGVRSGMADRVAALGGSLEVDSPLGQGTIVRAELPCAS
jgi:signal transduction histidine kinase